MNLNVTPFFWLILIAFIVALAARRVKVPYALALVITGLALGAAHLLPHTRLEPSLLFTVFLPPLLFESAIHLRVEALKRDWIPISIYTLVGTALSTFIVGGLTAWVLNIPLAAGCVFGALISATDPISVIAIFKKLGAGKRLTLIMEAESLFNDGAAAVLFAVMLVAVKMGSITVSGSLIQFARLVCGGTALGALIGTLASRVHYELNDHLVEITLTTVVAFGSYLCAETLHVSGVMAVVTAGLVIGNVGMRTSMSPGTQLAVTAFWEYAGFVVNSIVFLLVGMEVAFVDWRDKIGLAFGAVCIVLIGRAAIYPISLLVNRFKGNIALSWQHVLIWGGLRGALSMALVLGLDKNFSQRDTLVAATFGVVLFSLLVQGLTVGPLMKRLGLCNVQSQEPKDQRRLASELVACQAALAELEHLRGTEAHPNWSIELLMREYRARLTLLEQMLEEAQPGHKVLHRKQAARAQRLALEAEKSALQEAERQGWLDEDDWRDLSARIDGELVALSAEATASAVP
jgi:monovalent cation:H+ antiporter, CPA1 family